MVHPSEPHIALAKATRQRFCAQVGLILPRVSQDIKDHLALLLSAPQASRDVQTALSEFERHDRDWIEGVRTHLQRHLSTQGSTTSRLAVADLGALELVADEAIEDQLMASRLATRILETAGQSFSNLRLRMLFAEGRPELNPKDLFKPDVIASIILDEWVKVGIPRETWKLLQDLIAKSFSGYMVEAYSEANRFLVTNGVMPEIDLKHSVRRVPSAPEAPSTQSNPAFAKTARMGAEPASPATEWWTRARQQSQEVMGRIRRLFTEQTPARPESASSPVVSPHLKAMLDETMPLHFPQVAPMNPDAGGGMGVTISHADMEQYVQLVRQHSNQLKQATDSPSEKATIEVVALMFQSILTEDRLQPSLRVWFARLQIPVLRVALAEPDFFSSLQHPARRLIDRMGSCALGFDASLSDDASAQALEGEIRRVVQVIEQYPETGRRVFQLVYDEFQHFLANHLQTRGQASKLVSVAQQVELKETLTVQYTIELRKQLDDMPVREDIREFLFKVWAEVLAVASVKHDAKHEVMVSLKQVASDLLWAASAKPTRAERSQVIAQLPNLLARLRKGMTLLGIDTATQDGHIKRISDTLADAFMSKTETIPAAQLAAVTRNLSSLEDFLPQEDSADLELDQESIEMITGIDASNIEIITHGGQPPAEAVKAWGMELQLGSWFTLDHNGHVAQVQLAWRSARGQLCLFATAQQRFYLIQTTRMASYLQAGLLVPAEEESLTVRATRAALEKLDANPERLLA